MIRFFLVCHPRLHTLTKILCPLHFSDWIVFVDSTDNFVKSTFKLLIPLKAHALTPALSPGFVKCKL